MTLDAAGRAASLAAALADRYRIERELGGGGMSRVFVAEETALGRQVVVKVVAPELVEGVSAERFAREVKLAARLQQANIVPVLTAGDAAGVPYYTMPYVEGLSLRARLREGRLPIGEAVSILRDVARALAYAHDHGVVHRDIKPENVLLSGGAAVVTDFGIAKALSASRTQGAAVNHGVTGAGLTQAGMSLGTPAYMAPEQALGDPATDHRADLYAWGVMAWELLVGRHPFAAATTPHALIAAHMTELPVELTTARADVPPALSRLVRRCLEKEPARRPASAAEVLAALDDVATGPQSRHAVPTPTRRGGWRGLAIGATGMAVVVLALAAIWWRGRAAAPNATAAVRGQQSIAVLPFASVGGDTANVYFAEGIADELTTALAMVDGLRVAATSSAFTYRGRSVDPREVGKALHVGSVLQGRVRRAGAVLRVSAQLTNAADGLVLWSRSYDREAKDVFAVQDDLTREIVAALRITLASAAGATPTQGAGRGTRDLEAHDLYLRGLYFLNQRGPGVARSIPYFRQAIARDSTFARAWAQLGVAYGILPLFDLVAFDSTMRSARDAIDRALRLDSSGADAYTARGLVLAMTRQWDSARTVYGRALALDPNSVVTYRLALNTYAVLGLEAEADAAIRAVRQRDPLSATTNAVIAMTELSFGRRAQALATARRAVELDSASPMPRAMLAMTELAAGLPDAARADAHLAGHTANTSPSLGWVFAATGDRAAAADLVREAERQRRRSAAAELTIAWTALGAGDTTRALDGLERAAKAGEPVSFMVPFGLPAYDPLRRSARFAAVIRAFGANPAPFIQASRRRDAAR